YKRCATDSARNRAYGAVALTEPAKQGRRAERRLFFIKSSATSFAVNRTSVNFFAARRALRDQRSAGHFRCDNARRFACLTRAFVEPHAARFAKDPRRFDSRLAGRACLQFARHTLSLDKRLAAPFAITQPFGKIYIASIAVHH